MNARFYPNVHSRQNDVVLKAMRRNDVASTSLLHRFDVMRRLGKRSFNTFPVGIWCQNDVV